MTCISDERIEAIEAIQGTITHTFTESIIECIVMRYNEFGLTLKTANAVSLPLYMFVSVSKLGLEVMCRHLWSEECNHVVEFVRVT
jgi:hypothetical protein